MMGPEWLKTDLILSHFSGKDAFKAYREKVQGYGGEEEGLWEDFRHGVIFGSREFVDGIKARYASERPHKEIPQQRGLVGRIKAEVVLEQDAGVLDCGCPVLISHLINPIFFLI